MNKTLKDNGLLSEILSDIRNAQSTQLSLADGSEGIKDNRGNKDEKVRKIISIFIIRNNDIVFKGFQQF